MAFGFLLFAVLFVASLFLAYRPKLLIAQVSVTGNKTVSNLALRQVINAQLSGKYWGLYPKNNAFLYPRAELIAALTAAFPRLSAITLDQPDSRRLALTVKERRGEYLWCLPSPADVPDNDCYFADETGFVFAPAPQFSSPLYFEFVAANSESPLGRQALPEADWQKLLSAKQELSIILASSFLGEQKLWQAAPAELRDWYFHAKSPTGRDWEIRLDLDQDLTVAFQTLRSVLVEPGFISESLANQSELEYLDLRFAPKVFYRYNKE